MADAPDTLPAGTQMQNLVAPDTLPANAQVQNVQAPIGTQIANAAGFPGGPPPPDPAGFLGNVATGIENVGKSFMQLPGKLKADIQGAAPGPANESPIAAQQRGQTAIFRGLGDIAQTAFSPISEGINAGIQTAGNAVPSAKNAVTGGIGAVSDFISNSPIVQKLAMQHPQAEEDFNRALTLILLAAGGPKVAEAVPEGALPRAAATAKEVTSDLVKSPIQLAKATAQGAKTVGQAGVKTAQDILMPQIPENVRNSAAKMSTEQIQSLVEAQKQNRADAGNFSAMEKVGNTALRDLKTVNAKLSNVGAEKSAIMDSAAGREKVGPIVTKFLQGFNNAVRDKAQLRGDEALVRDIQGQATLIGNNPTAQAVDRFVDYVQNRIYSGSRDLTIPQSDAVEQVARQEVGKLNEALKQKMPEAYRTLNKKYSDMVKVRDEFNNAMGKGGDRAANFIKTLFSPFSARVKKVLPQVQALTGNDLNAQAQVAKHIMDVMGAVAQKSLLENQTGLNAAPSSLSKAAFDFGVHKTRQLLGGEDVQIQRLLQHASDSHLQSQTMKAMTPNTKASLNTIPRMNKNTGNTTTNTEIQKTTPMSQNVTSNGPSAGAMSDKVAQQDTIVKAVKLTKQNGGVTISLEGDVPKEGFAYAPSKSTETNVGDVRAAGKADFEKFKNDHIEELKKPGRHIGAWVDDNGNLILDVSVVEPDFTKAMSGAKKSSQDAVFDLGKLETHNLKDYEKGTNSNDSSQRGPGQSDSRSNGTVGKEKGVDKPVRSPKKPVKKKKGNK